MENYPEAVTKQCTKIILEQMNNSFYKINEKEGNFDIGYFCHIKSQIKIIPVIIINKFLTKEEFDKNTITISTNNGIKIIKLGDKKYRNKNYNITILEVKELKDYNLNFLVIDDLIYEEDQEILLEKKSIYIIQTRNIKDISVSYGLIKNRSQSNLFYTGCLISKGSPIFNLSNNKIIGIHENKSNYYNHGILLKFLINEFVNKTKKKKEINYFKVNNEINILIKVDKKDINKQVYFLDNYAYVDDKGKEHFHDNLKQLHKINTDLYINGEKYEYKKYFIPEKEGEYKIILIFDINLSDCSYMFAGCKNIIKVNFLYFNTENVVNMKYMFYKCENLQHVL